ncbi:hypothetical protein PUN28_009969 [Cardiocondyla obscurior]|uniref:Uncharacterized protein n=1 Tax=Cardiocondyla obscurior TaxID=286306 RepID=A0AAW2FNC3_9HYME
MQVAISTFRVVSNNRRKRRAWMSKLSNSIYLFRAISNSDTLDENTRVALVILAAALLHRLYDQQIDRIARRAEVTLNRTANHVSRVTLDARLSSIFFPLRHINEITSFGIRTES